MTTDHETQPGGLFRELKKTADLIGPPKPTPLKVPWQLLSLTLVIYLVSNTETISNQIGNNYELPLQLWGVPIETGYMVMSITALIALTSTIGRRLDEIATDIDYESSMNGAVFLSAIITALVAWAMSIPPVVNAWTCDSTTGPIVQAYAKCPIPTQVIAMAMLNLAFAGLVAAFAMSGWSGSWMAQIRRHKANQLAERQWPIAANALTALAGGEEQRAKDLYLACGVSRRFRWKRPATWYVALAVATIIVIVATYVDVFSWSSPKTFALILVFGAASAFGAWMMLRAYVWVFGPILLFGRNSNGAWLYAAVLIGISAFGAALVGSVAFSDDRATQMGALFLYLPSLLLPPIWMTGSVVVARRSAAHSHASTAFIAGYLALQQVKDGDGNPPTADKLWPSPEEEADAVTTKRSTGVGTWCRER